MPYLYEGMKFLTSYHKQKKKLIQNEYINIRIKVINFLENVGKSLFP